MIILVGGMIGTIIVSMFLPIFHLGDAIMRGGYNF
jgi:type II secretory pathway component PulF